VIYTSLRRQEGMGPENWRQEWGHSLGVVVEGKAFLLNHGSMR
jgi:hypothetical protein